MPSCEQMSVNRVLRLDSWDQEPSGLVGKVPLPPVSHSLQDCMWRECCPMKRSRYCDQETAERYHTVLGNFIDKTAFMMARHGRLPLLPVLLCTVTWRSDLCQTRFFSTAKWGYSSSPNYWMWLWGGPKGSPGVWYTNGVSAGVESLQHLSHPCLLLFGDDVDVHELSAVSGISTETPRRGSACPKESLPDCGFISTPRWWWMNPWCQEELQVPLLWHCWAISLFCSGKQPSVIR